MSSACSAPLTVSLMRMCLSLSFSLRMDTRVGDRAGGERRRHPPPVGSRGVQIFKRLDIGKRCAHRVRHLGLVKRRAGQLLFGGVEPDRKIRYGADADGDAFCLAVTA